MCAELTEAFVRSPKGKGALIHCEEEDEEKKCVF